MVISLTFQNMFGAGEHEADNVKRILLDNDPYILGFTFVISFIHMILDTFAFKNGRLFALFIHLNLLEIQFWRNKKSMEGMSVRTIYINFICQVIILLYLLDNPGTSWMILFSAVTGVLIEAWKVTRAVHVKVSESSFSCSPFQVGWWKGRVPYPILIDKQSYSATETKKYDLESMKFVVYLSLLIFQISLLRIISFDSLLLYLLRVLWYPQKLVFLHC
jgi:hypothetical protein